MKSPRDMRIIQIDITNACFHRCSNCTRYCGHHKKPFFMDFETFKRAVHSLDGYTGTIGLMGGEPTMHPEFAKFARYLAAHRAPKKRDPLIRPQLHFMDSIHDLELEHTFAYPLPDGGKRQTVNGPGLWSAIGEGYKKYYEVINDTIQYQALNDHSNPMYHQPSLVTRKELGIPDDEWVKLRDNCWVQNLWSATVTPKGAFFCEIAGALDMLFDGPAGWPIEPGWWQRTPEQFGDQLHWCELCGFACKTYTRDATEEVDDVSPVMFEKLKAIGSPKIAQGRYNLMKIENGVIAEESKASRKEFSGGLHYVDDYDDRFNEEKTNLFFKKLVGLVVLDTPEDADVLPPFLTHVEHLSVLGNTVALEAAKHALGDEAASCDFYDAATWTLGHVVYEVLYNADYNTYAVVLQGAHPAEQLFDRLGKLVLNPGTFLYTSQVVDDNDYFAVAGGTAAIFNGTAMSIREMGWDAVLRMHALSEIAAQWQPKKVIELAPSMERLAPSATIVPGKRYIVYGAGGNGAHAVEKIKAGGSTVVAVVDSNPARKGEVCHGVRINTPEILDDLSAFDYVLISTPLYYAEIKDFLLSKGVREEQVAIH